MPDSEIIRAARAPALVWTLPDGETVLIPAPTIDQARDCLRLDPPEGQQETHKQSFLRLFKQAKILLGDEFNYLTGILTLPEVATLIEALYLAACGMDAQSYARWQLAQRQLGESHSKAELLAGLEALTVELAARLSCLPSAVGAIPLADAVALRELINERREAEIDFQAALHGRTRSH